MEYHQLPPRIPEPKDPRFDLIYIQDVLAKPPKTIGKDLDENPKLGLTGLILDVGCGCNNTPYRWARDNPSSLVIGIDNDPVAIEHAKRFYLRGELEGVKPLPNLEFRVGNIYELAGTFRQKAKLISVSDALHHFDQLEDALAQIYQSLQSSGFFHFEDLNREAIEPALQYLTKWYALRGQFSDRELANQLFREEGNEFFRDGPTLANMMRVLNRFSFMAAYTLNEIRQALLRVGFRDRDIQLTKINSQNAVEVQVKDRYVGIAIKT